MKRLSWMYIAGLIDGEGCMDFQTTKIEKGQNGHKENRTYARPRLRLTLAEQGKDVIDSFHANFGGCVGYRKVDNPNWTDSYTWSIEGKRMIGFLQNIKGHLVIKKNQADFCHSYLINYMSKRFNEPAKGQEFRAAVVKELKAMKNDPHRLSDPAQIYESVMR